MSYFDNSTSSIADYTPHTPLFQSNPTYYNPISINDALTACHSFQRYNTPLSHGTKRKCCIDSDATQPNKKFEPSHTISPLVPINMNNGGDSIHHHDKLYIECNDDNNNIIPSPVNFSIPPSQPSDHIVDHDDCSNHDISTTNNNNHYHQCNTHNHKHDEQTTALIPLNDTYFIPSPHIRHASATLLHKPINELQPVIPIIPRYIKPIDCELINSDDIPIVPMHRRSLPILIDNSAEHQNHINQNITQYHNNTYHPTVDTNEPPSPTDMIAPSNSPSHNSHTWPSIQHNTCSSEYNTSNSSSDDMICE